ncbi:hypothetical protein ACFYTG_55225 [Streptomyces mirabilis]|uniref:hypothetical protein n=1 Tax=Streptomyces mirabilis TaxID=68239 RepID=UPI0036BC19EE
MPENLRDLDPGQWSLLFGICEEDGMRLAWAPRADIVDGLLAQTSRKDRHQYLVDHRLEVAEDVEAGLTGVNHPEPLGHVEFAREAVTCVRDGQDAAAQALAGNVIDTDMRQRGHTRMTQPAAGSREAGSGSPTHAKPVHEALAFPRRGAHA